MKRVKQKKGLDLTSRTDRAFASERSLSAWFSRAAHVQIANRLVARPNSPKWNPAFRVSSNGESTVSLFVSDRNSGQSQQKRVII